MIIQASVSKMCSCDTNGNKPSNKNKFFVKDSCIKEIKFERGKCIGGIRISLGRTMCYTMYSPERHLSFIKINIF